MLWGKGENFQILRRPDQIQDITPHIRGLYLHMPKLHIGQSNYESASGTIKNVGQKWTHSEKNFTSLRASIIKQKAPTAI